MTKRGRRPGEHAGEVDKCRRAGLSQKIQRAGDRRKAGEHRLSDRVEGVQIRAGEPRPRSPVAWVTPIERLRRFSKVAVERDSGTVRQRVGHAGCRVDPLQTVRCERHSRKHRGRHRRGIDGGERVVVKPRKRQLLSADRSARPVIGLQNDDRPPGLRQSDRGSEPIGPAADHDRVGAHDAIWSASWCSML
jgi:hypothetical protein